MIKTYNDFPKKGIGFKDNLGSIHDPEVFRELILKMSSNKVIKGSEAIVSIEARGFIFGSAISLQTSKPILVAWKTSWGTRKSKLLLGIWQKYFINTKGVT